MLQAAVRVLGSIGRKRMHDGVAGFQEIRIEGAGMNHRLFCVLERNAGDLGGSSIVVIDGLSKPKHPATRGAVAWFPRRTGSTLA